LPKIEPSTAQQDMGDDTIAVRSRDRSAFDVARSLNRCCPVVTAEYVGDVFGAKDRRCDNAYQLSRRLQM
jgi:hypothetical protein